MRARGCLCWNDPRPHHGRTMTPQTLDRTSTALLTRILERAHAQTMAMIHIANHRSEKRRGDPKVGGHPASCASSMHILGALHLVAREPQDFVCCKPHASPVDHTLHNLLQLFRRESDGHWFTPEESAALMHAPAQVPRAARGAGLPELPRAQRPGFVPLPALGLGRHPARGLGVPRAGAPLRRGPLPGRRRLIAHFWSPDGRQRVPRGLAARVPARRGRARSSAT